MSEWLDIKELASYLHIKPKSLYSMASTGRIPSYKVNRLLRFKRSEIDSWMVRNRKPEVDQGEEVKRILAGKRRAEKAVDDIVNNAIESTKREGRKNKPNRGHGKENNHDTV